jgi:hypothetical protein
VRGYLEDLWNAYSVDPDHFDYESYVIARYLNYMLNKQS